MIAVPTERPGPGDDLDEPRGQPGLLQQLEGAQRGERGLRVGLDDDAVARDQGGEGVGHRQHQRVVPRRDDADDALRDVVLAGGDEAGQGAQPTLGLERPGCEAGVVPGGDRLVHDLLERPDAGLAVLGLDEVEQLVLPVEHEVVVAQQHGGAVAHRGSGPRLLDLAGARHRGDDVLLGADRDLTDDGARQGRRDPERVAPLGRHGDAGGQAVGLGPVGTQGRSAVVAASAAVATGSAVVVTAAPVGSRPARPCRTRHPARPAGTTSASPGVRRYRGEMAGLRTLDVSRLRGRAVTRDPDEPSRASTPLELFFDLTFVVAVARASAALHHELAGGHVAAGVWGFVGVFFAVWWAWMNASWFASAHDADDVPLPPAHAGADGGRAHRRLGSRQRPSSTTTGSG